MNNRVFFVEWDIKPVTCDAGLPWKWLLTQGFTACLTSPQ